ncbi:MAG: hypothetical protein WC384_20245 [Prolixibacteraceae bacterium]|jgi:uncharacterized membrane protein
MKFKQHGLFSVLVILSVGSILFLVNSCQHDGTPADQMQQICFTDQILPVFQNSCGTTGCHSGGEHEYNFTNYAGIMRAITPGNADKSKAYKAMTSQFQLMPPNNALPIEKRTLIRLWIEQGANETTCDSPIQASAPNTNPVDTIYSWINQGYNYEQ